MKNHRNTVDIYYERCYPCIKLKAKVTKAEQTKKKFDVHAFIF